MSCERCHFPQYLFRPVNRIAVIINRAPPLDGDGRIPMLPDAHTLHRAFPDLCGRSRRTLIFGLVLEHGDDSSQQMGMYCRRKQLEIRLIFVDMPCPVWYNSPT